MSGRLIEAPRHPWGDPARWGTCLVAVLGLHVLAYGLLRAPPPVLMELPMLVDLAPDQAEAAPQAAANPPAAEPPPSPAPQPDPTPEPQPDPPVTPAAPEPPTSIVETPAVVSPVPSDLPARPVPLPPPRPIPARAPVRPRPMPVTRHTAPPPSAMPGPAPTETVAPAPPSPAPVAAPGPPHDASAAPSWQGRLMRRLHETLRYPPTARERERQGVAGVTFTMTREGHVLAASLAHSSGDTALDSEAVAMVRRADPLPAPPPEVGGATLTLSVPVQFSLRDRD